MKINDSIEKRKNLPMYVLLHLSFLSPSNTKSFVAVFTFIMLDLSLLPLLYPKVNIINLISIPLIVIAHLWAIRLLFKNPYSTQFETILFMGVNGVIGAICYFLLIQKTAYFNLGIEAVSYYVISTLIFIGVFVGFVFYQTKKYANIEDKISKNKKKNQNAKYAAVIAIFPALGYSVSQLAMDQSDLIMYGVMYFVFWIFVVLMIYFAARFLHQYVYMKLNMRFVIFENPGKKEMKQADAEGKGYIIK